MGSVVLEVVVMLKHLQVVLVVVLLPCLMVWQWYHDFGLNWEDMYSLSGLLLDYPLLPDALLALHLV